MSESEMTRNILAEFSTCNACENLKPVSEFYRRSDSSTGHRSYCKTCSNAQSKRSMAKKPDYYRAYKRANNQKYAATRREKVEASKRPCLCGETKNLIYNGPNGEGLRIGKCPDCRKQRRLERDRLYKQRRLKNSIERQKHREAKKRWNKTEYGQLYNQMYRMRYNERRRTHANVTPMEVA